MDARHDDSMPASAYRLCFAARYDGGCAYAFPCDADGRVDMDRLSERSRNDYFYARAVVGHALARPAVQRAG